ncbi:hypothetical protein [Phyllobacterium endophyticum]|uniref:hypothetical protein n=1 Tax=Phyllobacterium endophyticum TaxID=1149773 RepID=UPI000D1119D5|nr:hypothetical protein [Phyllobacterium endophyticum]MBB3235027.1 hypothetical protein [Phyllobacterium endophyticum]TYR39107.1 hypothetical protein FY050_24440 [Phyllobacterium endophyticum]
MRGLFLISCLLMTTTPVFAQAVDANGANALAATLSEYVGKKAIEKNIFAVVPDGDSYRITFSTAKLFESLPKQDYFKGDFGQYSLLARPLADGSWTISATAVPGGSVEVTAPTGPEAIEWSVDNGKMNGTFDPKIGTFSEASFSYGSMKMQSTGPTQDVEVSAGSAKGAMQGAAAASGGVDFSSNQSAVDFLETMTLKSPPAADDAAAAPQSPMKIVLSSRQIDVNAEGKGFRNLEFLDLWKFLIAHAQETTLNDQQQADLKTKLLAALPFWDKLSGAYQFSDLKVETPLGPFTAGNVSQEMDLDGVSKSGGYHYTLRTRGLKYPELPIPEWSVQFLPADMEIGFGMEGIDLDTLVRAAVADMDLKREKPFSDEFEAKTAAAFLASPPKVVIDKSFVKMADSEISVEGEVSFAAMKPASQTTWEMSNFDALVNRLTKASEQEPEIKNYIVFAKLAKDFGTQLPNGHIQWIVDQKADGSVSVNGNPVKGPDPMVEPGSDGTLEGDPTQDNNVLVPDDEEDSPGTSPAQ